MYIYLYLSIYLSIYLYIYIYIYMDHKVAFLALNLQIAEGMHEVLHPCPGSLAQPQSGSPTIPRVTWWGCGANLSCLERKRARAHQIGIAQID